MLFFEIAIKKPRAPHNTPKKVPLWTHKCPKNKSSFWETLILQCYSPCWGGLGVGWGEIGTEISRGKKQTLPKQGIFLSPTEKLKFKLV